MNFEGLPQVNTQKEKIGEVKENIYTLESGIEVQVSSKEFYPGNKLNGFDKTKGVILLPGWEAEPGDKTTMSLGKEFADSSDSITYAITTEINKNNLPKEKEIDKLYEESIAISKFIKDKKIKEVKIVGYSIGGDKAMNIVYMLQDDPEIKIDGLVLLASTGLYNQAPKDLVSNLLKDSFIKTPSNISKNENKGGNFKKWINVALDVNLNTVTKTIKSPSRVGSMINKIRETSKLNDRALELKVPIVLINGKDDLVSNEQKIAPVEDDNGEEIRQREKYLKENLFKNSPYIRMVVADRMGNHGLPYFRSKSIAETSLYLLDRFNRDKKE